MIVRQAQKAANALLLACVAARLVWPSIGPRLGYVFLLLGGARLALMIPDIRRGAEPWQRILVPGIVLLQVAVVLAGLASRLLIGVVTGVLEVALLGCAAAFTIRRYERAKDGRYPEEVLAESLAFFVPPMVAQAIAGEMANLGYALYGIARGFRLREPAGFSYLENSIVPYLTLAALFESPPEILLLHKLLRIQSAMVTAALIGVHVWAVLWVYGMYVGMRMRPHRASDGEIVLNRGALGTIRIAASTIASISPVTGGSEPAADLKFTVKGPPRLFMMLREPVRARRFLRGLSHPALTLLISVDRPFEFRDALVPRNS